MEKVIKIVKITVNITVGLIGALAIVLLIGSFGIIPQFKTYVVQSGSMEPALKTGSIVMVGKAPSYSSEDIISFKNGEGKNDVVTHRIVARMDNGLYYTKGDANSNLDQEKIKDEQIVGKVFFSLPFLGYFTEFVKKPYGFILFVIIPATIIVYEELKNLKKELLVLVLKIRRKSEKEKVAPRERNPSEADISAKGDKTLAGAGINKLFLIIPILGAAIAVSSLSLSFFSDSEQSQSNTMVAGVWETPPTPIGHGDVVINEIMWSGSQGNSADEWIELRNRTKRTIDLSNWVVVNLGEGNGPSANIIIPSGKNINPEDYFLISNDFKETSIINIDPDYQTADVSLQNNGEQLVLKDNLGNTIDTANGTGDWFSGSNASPKKSMERIFNYLDGATALAWHTATSKGSNLDASAPEFATPKEKNSLP